MKPYRTEQEALGLIGGGLNYRDYEDVLVIVPSEVVRGLIDLRVDKRYRQFKFANEFQIMRLFDWKETPEGGEYWAKVVGWMAGLNDLPELAKELKSDN